MVFVNLGSAAKVEITGLQFLNSGVTNTGATGGNSGSIAIVVVGDGVSTANRSVISNNTFTGLTDTAIVFSTSGGPQEHWLVSGNTFTNVNYGIFSNGVNDLSVTGNTFVSYIAGINNRDDVHAITNFNFVGNTFLGATASMSTAPTRALNLHMNASANDAAINWMISNNIFANHTGMALRFKTKASTYESLTGVWIINNSFVNNEADIVNETGSARMPAIRQNYWGASCGPITLHFTDGSAAYPTLWNLVSTEPWIKSYTLQSKQTTAGFWPANMSLTTPWEASGC
jgi:hypothetical protein